MTQALEKKADGPVGMGATGVSLESLDDLFRFGKLVVASGLAPQSYREPAQVMVAVQMGLEVGLAPMQALQSIAVINGRPSLWGDGARAVILRSGLLEDQAEEIVGSGDQRTAVVRLKRVGIPTWFVGRFSVADAKKAGLWTKKGPWQDYPEVMLLNRARALAQRHGFADALRGLALAEEVRDWREPPRETSFEARAERNEARMADLLPVEPESAATQADPEPEPERGSDPEPEEHLDEPADDAEVDGIAPEFADWGKPS